MKRRRDDAKKTLAINAPKFIEGYKKHFNRDPLQRNENWSPKVSCISCYKKLTKPNSTTINILSPMEWNEPVNHPNDCYFCKIEVPIGINKMKREMIGYADVPSVRKPTFISGITQSDDSEDNDEKGDLHKESVGEAELDEACGSDTSNVKYDIPMETEETDPNTQSERIFKLTSSQFDADFRVPRHFSKFQPKKKKSNITLSQERFNDMVRDLDSSKENAEILASRLTDMGVGDSKY